MTKARQYFKKLGHGSIKACADYVGCSDGFLSRIISQKCKCTIQLAAKICEWTKNELGVDDFLTRLIDSENTSKAKKYFHELGDGSIQRCASEIGFTRSHLSEVINHKRKCSLFNAQCISTWSNGILTTDDFLIGGSSR